MTYAHEGQERDNDFSGGGLGWGDAARSGSMNRYGLTRLLLARTGSGDVEVEVLCAHPPASPHEGARCPAPSITSPATPLPTHTPSTSLWGWAACGTWCDDVVAGGGLGWGDAARSGSMNRYGLTRLLLARTGSGDVEVEVLCAHPPASPHDEGARCPAPSITSFCSPSTPYPATPSSDRSILLLGCDPAECEVG